MRSQTKALVALLWMVGSLCALPYVHAMGSDDGAPAALSLVIATASWPILGAYWCLDQIAHALIAITT